MHTYHEVRPLAFPESLAAAEAAPFREMVAVRNQIYAEISGNDDESLEPADLLPHYRESAFAERLVWTLHDGGRMVGRAGVDFPAEEGSTVAYAQIELLRRSWGAGLGTAALDVVTDTARARGRTVVEVWAEHPNAEGTVIRPPHGYGHVPLDHVAHFARARGFQLEQVERKSVLDLTDLELDARIARLRADAEAAAADYDVVHWCAPTPPWAVEDYAWMKSRMSTDVPAAGLEFEEEVWDAERVAEHDRIAAQGWSRFAVTAARHRPSQKLVAFTELAAAGAGEVARQEDTLVVAEHRGHRLGMLLKCAALQEWRAAMPQTQRITTYNAEENRPMLRVNEDMGFAPVAAIGAWKKLL